MSAWCGYLDDQKMLRGFALRQDIAHLPGVQALAACVAIHRRRLNHPCGVTPRRRGAAHGDLRVTSRDDPGAIPGRQMQRMRCSVVEYGLVLPDFSQPLKITVDIHSATEQ